MESSAKQETQPKPRLIVRLGVFLASHHILFRFTLISPYVCSLNPSFGPFFLTHPSPFEISVICCFAGIIALLLLPSLAKNTYLSENALIPGSANPLFSTEDAIEANRFMKGIEAAAGVSIGGMYVTP
nr:unnamed protein product [Digitaria exilis]